MSNDPNTASPNTVSLYIYILCSLYIKVSAYHKCHRMRGGPWVCIADSALYFLNYSLPFKHYMLTTNNYYLYYEQITDCSFVVIDFSPTFIVRSEKTCGAACLIKNKTQKSIKQTINTKTTKYNLNFIHTN